jgi:hypothetical protein
MEDWLVNLILGNRRRMYGVPQALMPDPGDVAAAEHAQVAKPTPTY